LAALIETQLLRGDATYDYRHAMMAAAPLIDGQVTAGAFSYAFRLYNTSVPVLNPYQYQYSAAGRAEYEADTRRLISEGIASATVSVPGNSDTLVGYGLHAGATYAVDAEKNPEFVVFVR
jgi:hypothetical protein